VTLLASPAQASSLSNLTSAMGLLSLIYEAFAKVYERVFAFSKPTRILLVGLDAAGKTTLLYKLKLNELITTIPTIGFNVEQLNYKNLEMTMWDVGGQDKIRALWRYYFENSDAVIFVVDSADRDRMAEARETLHSMLADDALRNAHLLVLANKQDLHTSVKPAELHDRLGLRELRRPWYLQACSAVSGDGIYEGLDWLHSSLSKRKAPSMIAAAA